jgi:hypothetical protein
MWISLSKSELCLICGSASGTCERGSAGLEAWRWCSSGDDRDVPGLQQYGDSLWKGIYGPPDAVPPRGASPAPEDLSRRAAAHASRVPFDRRRVRMVARAAIPDDEGRHPRR